MTIVINLFGGAGLGKTTCAADTFAQMKKKRYHVEYVSEYVKKWAWLNRTPNGYDQFYLAGKQSQAESILYGKLDYIITDSPILLSGFYESHHLGRPIVLPAILNFLDYTKDNGVKQINFWLSRNKEYDTRGRWETEEEAIAIDTKLKQWLISLNIPLIEMAVDDDDRPNFIMSHIG